MLWQYRTMLFEFTKDGLLGDKYVDDEDMEKTLNQLGAQAWELVNVTLLQDGVLAFLKRPAGKAMDVEVMPEVEPAPAPPQPVIRSRASVPRATLPVEEDIRDEEQERAEERALLRGSERPRKPAPREDDTDFIGGIRIS